MSYGPSAPAPDETVLQPPMPIIVGAPRSGTTLLRFMLDAHPEMAIPPETGFLVLAPQLASQGRALRERFFEAITCYPPEAPAWRDFGIADGDFRVALQGIEPFTVTEGYRAFYRLYARRYGKPRWGDKTPMYGMHLQAIARTLPEARFVHIIRDGRDVALSLRPLWFSPGSTIETLANHWSHWVSTTRRDGLRCRHYLEVHFEDLVREPRAALMRICAFVDLGYHSGMLRYHRRSPLRLTEHRDRNRIDGSVLVTQEQRYHQQQRTTQPPDISRVFAWKRSLSPAERARYEAIAGEVLERCGYEVADHGGT